MHRSLKMAGPIALLSAVSTTAHAQYAIINDVIASTIANMSRGSPCNSMPEKELAEAREPGIGLMQRYFDAASRGGSKSASFKLSKKTKWISGNITAGAEDLNQQVDPIAVKGSRLDPAPLRFYRAFSYGTALGQWAVYGADGSVSGVYTGLFEKGSEAWKLRELTIYRAADVVEPVAPYCYRPGDATQQNVASTQTSIDFGEKLVAKRKAKFDAADAVAGAAEKSGGSSAAALRATADREKKKLGEAEDALVKSREAHNKAVSYAEDIKRLTLPAREAEQFRDKPEEKKPG